MSKRREQITLDIKIISERIEVKLSEYKSKYHKELPADAKRRILKNLKNADSEAEILVFEAEIKKYSYFDELLHSNSKTIINNIYNCLDNVVHEVLNCYNDELSGLVSDIIDSIKYKLVINGYKVETEFKSLSNSLSVSNQIASYEEKYSELVELKEIISIVTDIKSIMPGTLVPETYELYGVRALLLELEEKLNVIEYIEETEGISIILKYIDSSIEWQWFKEIR